MLTTENTCLVVIDIQEKLLRLMQGSEQVVNNTAVLIQIAKALDIPVELQDERLTTVEATRRKREGGSRERIDSLAACVLLDAYLARVA